MNAKKVLCTCPIYNKNTFVNDAGIKQKGLYIHPSTSRKHWAKSNQLNDNAEESMNQLSLEDFTELIPNLKSKKTESEENYSSDSNVTSYHDYKPKSIDRSWLYLICGISQEKCQKAISYIIFIIKHCRQLPQGIKIETTIPKDVRTISKHLKLIAEFDFHICCSSCYSLYEIEIAPSECGYRATLYSLICGEDLFNPLEFLLWEEIPRALQQRLELPQCKKAHRTNPRSIFVSQRFTDWLKWILGLPGVESAIKKWRDKLSSNSCEVVDYNHSHSFHQSLLTTGQLNESSSSLQLKFSLFADWFNPLGNKISGKQVSLGVLALT
ncbi:hypothetical protein O181_014251 [Austropuccinia psidii MF-1]|uniref:Uncharacterized protein n=1 Tax=Austropuccinia psidii MF-1 TaxID=1389203 RepID=A0A9Q3GNZ6_9BASI|nr:hypothetical protein [Austropuccinia psidii MF-1]